MLLYFCVLIVFLLHRELLKLILVDKPGVLSQRHLWIIHQNRLPLIWTHQEWTFWVFRQNISFFAIKAKHVPIITTLFFCESNYYYSWYEGLVTGSVGRLCFTASWIAAETPHPTEDHFLILIRMCCSDSCTGSTEIHDTGGPPTYPIIVPLFWQQLLTTMCRENMFLSNKYGLCIKIL
jgi:hypothetical protein